MVNYVQDSLHTPANDVSAPGAGLVLEQVSDYWSANTTVGFALDEQDSLFLSYDYFFASDFEDNSSVSVPYGLDRKDQTFGATWTRRLGDKVSFTFRYMWAKNNEPSSAGLNNFEANLFYGKMDYRF